MPLSKHYIDTRESEVHVDRAAMADCFEREFSEVVFALLHGSAKEGVIQPHSDLDLAVFADPRLTGDRFLELSGRISAMHQGVRCDLGILNNVDPVYGFETLKGDLVFCRDRDAYARFFSEICRRYEATMARYARQHRYRRESAENT